MALHDSDPSRGVSASGAWAERSICSLAGSGSVSEEEAAGREPSGASLERMLIGCGASLERRDGVM